MQRKQTQEFHQFDGSGTTLRYDSYTHIHYDNYNFWIAYYIYIYKCLFIFAISYAYYC